MTALMRFLALGLCLIAGPVAAAVHGGGGAGAAIVVDVSGVRDDRGVVRVDVCPRERFLKDGCPWHGFAPSHAGTVSVRIEGVPPGDYAAQGFQDANDNDRVDRGLFGIPREGIGFSRDAPIRLSPPKWEDAVFAHGAGEQRITFGLRYW